MVVEAGWASEEVRGRDVQAARQARRRAGDGVPASRPRRTSVRAWSPVTQGSGSVPDAPGAAFLPGKTACPFSRQKLPLRLSPQSLWLPLILPLLNLEIRTRDGKPLGRGQATRRKESQALIPESLTLAIFFF